MRKTRVVRRAGAAVVAALGATLLLGAAAAPADASTQASCYASGGHLFCGNQGGGLDLMNLPSYNPPSKYVDTLETVFSRFECYTTGDPHSGGNNVWYKAQGDIHGRYGYVAAAYVWTPKDPFPGVNHC
jgi:hypothetical protein